MSNVSYHMIMGVYVDVSCQMIHVHSLARDNQWRVTTSPRFTVPRTCFLCMSLSRMIPGPRDGVLPREYTVAEVTAARDDNRLCWTWKQEEAYTKKMQRGEPLIAKKVYNGGCPNHEGAVNMFFKEHNIEFDDYLEFDKVSDDGKYLRYTYLPNVGSSGFGRNGKRAYHAGGWYSAAGIVASGVVAPSTNPALGHGLLERTEAEGGGYHEGTYVTPSFTTAEGSYAIAHDCFNDGSYHKFVVELEVNKQRCTHRKAGSKHTSPQWVFQPDDTIVRAIYIATNCVVQAGSHRLHEWISHAES